MSLNVKNPEAVRLVATLAHRLHTTQVGAITDAVTARLASLDYPQPSVDTILADVWRARTPAESHRIDERMAGLYDEAGLPA